MDCISWQSCMQFVTSQRAWSTCRWPRPRVRTSDCVSRAGVRMSYYELDDLYPMRAERDRRLSVSLRFMQSIGLLIFTITFADIRIMSGLQRHSTSVRNAERQIITRYSTVFIVQSQTCSAVDHWFIEYRRCTIAYVCIAYVDAILHDLRWRPRLAQWHVHWS